MAKRHGRKDESGRIMRRGNHSGSLYQKKAGGIWYMRFVERDDEGNAHRVAFSTKTTNLDEARQALDDKAKELGFGNDDERHVAALLNAKHNLDNRREAIARERAEAEARAKAKADAEAAIERESRATSLAEAFAIYLTSKRRPDSGDVTLSHYESQYSRFVRWMHEHHPEVSKMRGVTPDMAEAFLDELENTQSRNTRNKYLIFLRMFWRVMRWEADAQLVIDPWDGIRTLTQTPDEVVHRELTVEELAAVAAVINSNEPLPIIREKGNAQCKAGNIRDCFTYKGENIRDELRLLFAVGIWTGQRLGDCAMMEWAGEDSSIDLVRDIVTVTPRKTKRKYKRTAIIPLHPTFAAILAEIPKARRKGYLMPTVATMYQTCCATLSRTVQAIMTKAGIVTTKDAPQSGSKVRTVAGFHSLRHTFSSIMLNAGASPAHVDAMLTHAKGTMTMRYFHEHAEALAVAVAHLPTLPQFALDQQAAVDAATDAPLVTDAQSTAPTPDAPRGIIEAIREHLDGASVDELQDALAIIRKAISTKRSEARS